MKLTLFFFAMFLAMSSAQVHAGDLANYEDNTVCPGDLPTDKQLEELGCYIGNACSNICGFVSKYKTQIKGGVVLCCLAIAKGVNGAFLLKHEEKVVSEFENFPTAAEHLEEMSNDKWCENLRNHFNIYERIQKCNEEHGCYIPEEKGLIFFKEFKLDDCFTITEYKNFQVEVTTANFEELPEQTVAECEEMVKFIKPEASEFSISLRCFGKNFLNKDDKNIRVKVTVGGELRREFNITARARDLTRGLTNARKKLVRFYSFNAGGERKDKCLAAVDGNGNPIKGKPSTGKHRNNR